MSNSIKTLLLALIISTLNKTIGQEIHFGPMLGYANTTINTATGNIIIDIGGGNGSGTEKENTGYSNNFAIGGFFTISNSGMFLGSELFYSKTTSQDLDNVSLSHLQVIPTIGGHLFKSNFYLELGTGIGIVLEKQGIEDTFRNNEVRPIDITGKLSGGHHFENIGRIEIGVYASSEFIESQANRTMFVLTTKFHLDSILQ